MEWIVTLPLLTVAFICASLPLFMESNRTD
jgi:lipopolysaccharide export LptBFGC system permease protein LptF